MSVRRLNRFDSDDVILGFVIFSVCVFLALCFTSCRTALHEAGPIIEAAAANLPVSGPSGVESAPVASPSEGGEEIVSAGAYARPAIAAGHSGAIFVAAEGAKMQSAHLFVRSAAGTWAGTLLAQSAKGGPCDASRVYVPDAVVDSAGWCWVSMRCGPKEWGSMHGPAIYVRSPAGAGTWKFLGLTTGAARLALDDSSPGAAILLTKNGAWGAVDRQGNVTRTGNYPAGSTGEKFAFAIAGSMWVSAHNGYSEQSSACTIGTAAGGPRQTWAAYLAYPAQGNDLNYPSLCIVTGAAPRVYVLSVYSGALRVQVFQNGKPRYPADALPSLGEATQEERCPPRLVATAAGAVAVYVKSGSIYQVNVERRLAGQAVPARIGAGTNPAVCTDAAGALHMAYIQGGALRYRRLN